jgi:hypothetical protein
LERRVGIGGEGLIAGADFFAGGRGAGAGFRGGAGEGERAQADAFGQRVVGLAGGVGRLEVEGRDEDLGGDSRWRMIWTTSWSFICLCHSA